MASKTELANMALVLIGQTPIADLDSDATVVGVEARTFFDQARDELQAAHNWNFNQFRQALNVDSAAEPAYGYDYAFTLPTDPYCFRVLGTNHDDDQVDWSVEGRFLLIDESTVSIHYLGRETNTGKWSPWFVKAFTPLLASKMAYPRTQSMSVVRDMISLHDLEMKKAKNVDSKEQPIKYQRSTTLTRQVRG
jgi:hypothetical protein